MFIQNPDLFNNFDISNAREFVQYWRQFYHERVTIFGATERIDYFAEVDPTRPLTSENVRRLLRWKDPRLLTHLVGTGLNAGRLNARVERVTRHLARLNEFRAGTMDESGFMDWTASVFRDPCAWVWRIFLAHIARPAEYPIVDQHVLRAYQCHTGDSAALNWSTYQRYRDYFERIVAASSQSADSQLALRKQTDDALFAFGQFLKVYWARLAPRQRMLRAD